MQWPAHGMALLVRKNGLRPAARAALPNPRHRARSPLGKANNAKQERGTRRREPDRRSPRLNSYRAAPFSPRGGQMSVWISARKRVDRRAIQSGESKQPITPAQDAATSTYHAGVPTPPQDAGTPTHHGFVDRDEHDGSGDSDE
jgi:hypothetical protein